MERKGFWILAVAGMLMASGFAFAHCEIPCGIFDDEAQFNGLQQDVDTIEKSSKEIAALQAAEKPDMNQLVRWVNNKDAHADKIKESVAAYFLSQRVKFPENEGDRESYVRQLELLHRITVYAMKAKQSLDPENILFLRESLDSYQKLYGQIHGHKHD
jgi:nickel superoxide dismutase